MKQELGGKHRRSIRLKQYDYAGAGYYFVTICAQGKQCLFGEIQNGEMILNDVGKIISECWSGTLDHFDGVSLDEFVVMPNHIHGIVVIENGIDGWGANVVRDNINIRGTSGRGAACCAPTNVPAVIKNIIKPNSLPAIVRSFKSAVSKKCRERELVYDIWQRNYYEHIIRNENELFKIRNYIHGNPSKWQEDKLNGQRI